MERKVIKSVYDLEVYSLAYSLALEVFELTKRFPKEELYSLTDQIRRSSRSVPANINEGFAKKQYENVFKQHLITAMGSVEETKTWIDFAKDFSYITIEQMVKIKGDYIKVGAMLFRLIQNWHTI
jgi:four helix bundle protein